MIIGKMMIFFSILDLWSAPSKANAATLTDLYLSNPFNILDMDKDQACKYLSTHKDVLESFTVAADLITEKNQEFMSVATAEEAIADNMSVAPKTELLYTPAQQNNTVVSIK
jgi:hypothetical protein